MPLLRRLSARAARTLVGCSLVLGVALAPAPLRALDIVSRLTETLTEAKSVKVRVQAVALLARAKAPAAFAAIGRAALWDPEPLVRGFALRLLAKNPGGDARGEQARAILLRARSDRAIAVRQQAAASQLELDRLFPAADASRHAVRTGPFAVAVGNMGDRSGRASAAIRAQMRSELISQLRSDSNIRVADVGDPLVAYIVDGTIRRLEMATGSVDVETTCAVELLVSRPPRGLVLVASGEATVQKPRTQFRVTQQPGIEGEALQHAVKSAHENLSRFLAAQ